MGHLGLVLLSLSSDANSNFSSCSTITVMQRVGAMDSYASYVASNHSHNSQLMSSGLPSGLPSQTIGLDRLLCSSVSG